MRLIDIIGQAQPHEAREKLARAQRNGAACPAANVCGDKGIECRIEQVLIEPQTDPTTLTKLCCDRYELCPTLRRHHAQGQTAGEYGKQVRAEEARKADKDNELMERLEYYGRQG